MQNVTLSPPHSSNTNIPVLINQLQVSTLLYFSDSVLLFQFPFFEWMQTLIFWGTNNMTTCNAGTDKNKNGTVHSWPNGQARYTTVQTELVHTNQ